MIDDMQVLIAAGSRPVSMYVLCRVVQHRHQLRCERCRRYSDAHVMFESQMCMSWPAAQGQGVILIEDIYRMADCQLVLKSIDCTECRDK